MLLSIAGAERDEMNSLTPAERIKLEQERLSRQKRRNEELDRPDVKRKDSAEKSVKRIKITATGITDNEIIEISDDDDEKHAVTGSKAQASSSRAEISKTKDNGTMFWDGESRSVRNQLVSNPAKTFSLEEIVGDKSELELVVAASFCWEMDWFMQHLPDPTEVPTVILTQPTGDCNGRVKEADEYTEGFKRGSVVSFAFLPGGFGCQHMKFLLLFYRIGRLRVVVTSANMRSADWYIMDNTVFVQDIMRQSPSRDAARYSHSWPSQFEKLFQYTRMAQAFEHLRRHHGKRQSAILALASDRFSFFLHQWDWTRVKSILVMSLPGSHGEGEKLGMVSVAVQLRDKGWIPSPNETTFAEYQSSSLCKLTPKWAHHFHACLSGKPMAEIAKMKIPSKLTAAEPPIKILYPTLKTVDDTLLGREGGGSMFCTPLHFTPETRPYFADSVCKYGSLLMHTKMILCMFRRSNRVSLHTHTSAGDNFSNPTADVIGGWAYVAGSHNLSQAAWGHLSFPQGNAKLYIKNYELGVILPLPQHDLDRAADQLATWKRPARLYAANDEPFMQTVHLQSQ